MRERGYHKGLLITTKSLVENGIAKLFVAESDGLITDFTYGIQPNPTVQNTDYCIQVLRSGKLDFVVALVCLIVQRWLLL